MTGTMWFRLAGGASLVVAAVAVIALVANSSEQEVRTDRGRPFENSLPRYGGPTLSVPQLQADDSLEAEAGEGPAPASQTATPPPAPAVSPSSAPTLQCRNSFDPACGAFYFSPPPPPNQPASVEVSFDPANPVAGEPVVVTVTGTDPDATSGYLDFHSSCRSDTATCEQGPAPTWEAGECSEPHGAWDTPPPPVEPLVVSYSFTAFFDQPGEHQYFASIETSGPLPASWATTALCRPRTLYGSQSATEGVITVAPPPPADSTEPTPVAALPD